MTTKFKAGDCITLAGAKGEIVVYEIFQLAASIHKGVGSPNKVVEMVKIRWADGWSDQIASTSPLFRKILPA